MYFFSSYRTVIFGNDTAHRMFFDCLGEQCYRAKIIAKIVFPSAEIMLPFDGIYTRASPRTLHNISYPAAVSFDAGYYNRAWVREYNPVTQVRRRNSDVSAILSKAWNDSRKLQQLRCGSEICAFTHW